jgi:hypothetical protein
VEREEDVLVELLDDVCREVRSPEEVPDQLAVRGAEDGEVLAQEGGILGRELGAAQGELGEPLWVSGVCGFSVFVVGFCRFGMGSVLRHGGPRSGKAAHDARRGRGDCRRDWGRDRLAMGSARKDGDLRQDVDFDARSVGFGARSVGREAPSAGREAPSAVEGREARRRVAERGPSVAARGSSVAARGSRKSASVFHEIV